jgi:hypothetical protein
MTKKSTEPVARPENDTCTTVAVKVGGGSATLKLDDSIEASISLETPAGNDRGNALNAPKPFVGLVGDAAEANLGKSLGDGKRDSNGGKERRAMIRVGKQAARFNIEDASLPEDIQEQALHCSSTPSIQTHQAPEVVSNQN